MLIVPSCNTGFKRLASQQGLQNPDEKLFILIRYVGAQKHLTHAGQEKNGDAD